MASLTWAVWSWDGQNSTWVAVAEGTARDMRRALERKQAAAARHLPSARFIATPRSQPPQDPPEDIPEDQEQRRRAAESLIRALFQAWLMERDDSQLAALAENWENVMDDAALDRVDSWVIAGRAITELHSRQASSGQEHG